MANVNNTNGTTVETKSSNMFKEEVILIGSDRFSSRATTLESH